MFIIIDKNTNKIKQTISANYGIEVNENELIQEVAEEFIEKFNNAQEYKLIFEGSKVTDIEILKTWEEWQNEQPIVEPQKTKDEIQQEVNAKLLKDSANLQIELEKQKKINATLLVQVAQLGGNV